jgi:hypothetical protein
MKKEDIKSIKNYIDPSDAKLVIDIMDSLKLDGKLSNERKDNTYRVYNSDNETLSTFIKKYSDKFINGRNLYVSEYLVAMYQKDAFMKVHKDVDDDREVVSTVLYLNDEYTGGELSFPEIDNGYTYIPEKYELVYFPTPYLHGVNPVKSGKRYIVTISYTDKIEHKNPNY